MAENIEATDDTRRPLWLWIGAAAAVVVVIALIVWGIVANASPSAAPSTLPTSASPSASGEPSGSASPEPSESASPSPSAEPTDEPDDPGAQPSPRPTKKPVDIDEPAVVEKGVTVSLASIESIQGTVTVPGDEAGPALLITVEAVNESREEISTPAVIVNVYYGEDETPAGILTRPREDFPPVLAAGETESGQFAFTVPTDQRDDIRIEVDLSVGSPVVLFEGSVS